MEDKIYTAKDRAQEMGFVSWHAVLEHISGKIIPHEISEGASVYAVIDGGRWLAKCGGNCKGSNYVDPDEDGFYCTTCFNVETGGLLRHVIWPENKAEIEAEIMKRPCNMPKGMFGTQGAAMATGLPRAWNPEETMEDLILQREAYDQVTKDDLMRAYLETQAKLDELTAALAAKEGE